MYSTGIDAFTVDWYGVNGLLVVVVNNTTQKVSLSSSDPVIQTISMLMYFKHVLSILRTNFCRTVLVLFLLC
jgi:hypothetical protein